MNFPKDLKYTKEHEWIKVENGIGTIGITDFAQSELGDIVFVELPEVGRNLTQNETFGTIEAVKAVSDLYSPISGEVVEINETLTINSEKINTSPYNEGWIIKIKFSDEKEIENLLSSDSYRELIGK